VGDGAVMAEIHKTRSFRTGPGLAQPSQPDVGSIIMTVQTFRELLTAAPFCPFRLIMSSGQAYEVRHPEMALLTRTSILVGTGDTEEGVPAEFKICSLLHVTAVEPIGVAESKPAGNG
jgi:hypothetical protein